MLKVWLSVEDIAEYLGVLQDTDSTLHADEGTLAHELGHSSKFQTSGVAGWVGSGGAAAQENDG